MTTRMEGLAAKYLPCPICNCIDGCDHTFTEREQAATPITGLDDAPLHPDTVRMNWIEKDNNSKDYGGTWQVRTGDTVGNFRAAIDQAMARRED